MWNPDDDCLLVQLFTHSWDSDDFCPINIKNSSLAERREKRVREKKTEMTKDTKSDRGQETEVRRQSNILKEGRRWGHIKVERQSQRSTKTEKRRDGRRDRQRERVKKQTKE